MTELAKYDAACRMLAEVLAVDEVQEIRNQAEAWRHYAHQAKNRDLEIGAVHIRFRAERRLGLIIREQKETIGLNRGRAGAGRPALGGSSAEPPKIDERPTLEQAGINKKLSMRAQKMAAIEPEKFEKLLELHRAKVIEQNNKVSVDLMRTSAEADRRKKRRQLALALSDATAGLPTGRKFPCVYADPPWRRERAVTDLSHENHCSTMSWDQICAMPVADLLLPDAWVFLRVPRAYLFALHPVDMEFAEDDCRVTTRKIKQPLAWAVAQAWGCDDYSTCFVWTKTDEDHPDDIGGGVLVRDQDELLLLFKRGRGLPKPATDEKFRSNHRKPVREHSRTPDHYRDMIRSMTGGVPVLELFARVDDEHQLPPDWHAWGNQAQITIAAIEPQPSGAIMKPAAVTPAVHIAPESGEFLEIPASLRRSADNVAPFFPTVPR